MPQGLQVVVTGIGAVTPIGVGADIYWNALCNKESGLTPLPHASSPPQPGDIGGIIPDFDPKAYVRPRKALKVMCRELQTSFAASRMAFTDSGFEAFLDQEDSFDRGRIGTVFGSEMFYGSPAELAGTIDTSDDPESSPIVHFGKVAMKEIYPLWMLKYLPNMAACHVGIAVQAFGPNNTLVLGDTSGPAATLESISCIERGIADAVFSGAAGNRTTESGIVYHGRVPLAPAASSPENWSRPFAPDRGGMVGGEAAATLLLESSELATRRGAKTLATVVGSAVRFVPSQQRGSQRAIELAIQAALKQAGRQSEEIGLVVSHAMGDPEQDAAELKALTSQLSQAAITTPMASTGHCGAASGTLAVVTGVLALQHGTVPPARTSEAWHKDFPFTLPSEPQPLEKRLVLCVSHTAQGHAVAILLA